MNFKEKLLKIKNMLLQSEKDEKVEISSPYTTDEIIQILENAARKFFPKNGMWSSCCFNRSTNYDMHNLPCHLRDSEWLATMLRINQNIEDINLQEIVQFIESSSLFAELRHNYELEIVRWQIDWMKNDGKGWIVTDELGGDDCLILSMCDIAFRKGVVDTLTAIGMDKEVIEEGIEKNVDIWLEEYMKKAYYQQFNELFTFYYVKLLDSTDPEFEEAWLKFRRYEYYQAHKDSVDKYGKVTEDMKMSAEELKQLRLFLVQKHGEKMIEINKWKIEHDDDKQKLLIMF